MTRMQTLNDREQEKCETNSGLFEVLNEKFKYHNNRTILSLQYCKLIREEKSVQEWIGHLKATANECEYKKKIGDWKNNL